MSSDLEQRLQRALAEVEPGQAAGEQAREAALAALPHGVRGRHRLALVAAAAVAGLALAGAALAASRTARETLGLADRQRPAAVTQPRLAEPLPSGSGGFAAYGGGRLWLASPGLNVNGRRYSTAELSPGALNMVVGAGHSLKVVRLSDGSVAWRHATGGQVVAAAWAPIGTEIAYVAHTASGYQLRMIEGDGDHDRLLASDVSPVKPSWRSDSLTIAYADSHHQVAVDDFTTGRTTIVRSPRSCPLVTTYSVAYAPRGGLLAASTGDGNMLLADPQTGWARCAAPAGFVLGPLPPAQFAWISGRTLVGASYQFIAPMTIDGRHVRVGNAVKAPAGIGGITVSPDARQLAVGLMHSRRVEIVSAPIPRPGDTALSPAGTLRWLPNPESGMRPVLVGRGVTVPAWYTLIWR